MTAKPATPREVVQTAVEKWWADYNVGCARLGLTANIMEALTAAGYRIAGPDEVVVPREPTNQMMFQGAERYRVLDAADKITYRAEACGEVYRAMLNAAEGDGR